MKGIGLRGAGVVPIAMLGGGQAVPAVPIVYLLRDLFVTDDAAPLTSPRTCEPGPGTLTITDTGNELSISGGDLVMTSGTVYKLVGGALARSAGLAAYTRFLLNANSGDVFFGWSDNGSNYTHAIAQNTGAGYNVYFGGSSVSTQAFSSLEDANHEYLIIQRATGFYVLIRGGRFGRWSVMYVCPTGTDASIRPLFYGATNANGTAQEIAVYQMLAPYASDFGLAASYTAAPASPIQASGHYNGWVEIVWTPQAGETLEMDLHKIDADNRGIVRCSQAGSTIKLISRIGGIETEKASGAQVWTVGTPYRVAVRIVNRVVIAFLDNTARLNIDGATPTLGRIYGASGFTVASDFAYFPFDIDMPAPFSDSAFRFFLGGKSKSGGE